MSPPIRTLRALGRALLSLLALVLAARAAPRPAGYDSRQRHPVLLASSSVSHRLDGVRWGFSAEHGAPEFVPAMLRRGAVREVQWWSENFPPEWIAAHGMLAFLFEDSSALVAADGRRSIGLVVSIEARLPEGDSFSLTRGLTGRFRLVHMLTSLEDRLQQAVVEKGHSVDVSTLLLSPEERQRLLDVAVESATTPRESSRYDTLRRNCVSELVALLRRVLPPGRRPGRDPVLGVPDLHSVIPKLAVAWLRREGLLGPPAGRIGPETEILAYPDTSARAPYRIRVRDLPPAGGAPEARALALAVHQLLVLDGLRQDLEARTRRARGQAREDLGGRRREVERQILVARDRVRLGIEEEGDGGIATYLSLAPPPATSLVPLEFDLWRMVQRRRLGEDAPHALLDHLEDFLEPRLTPHVRLPRRARHPEPDFEGLGPGAGSWP